TSGQMSQLAGFYNGAVGLDYDVANTVSIYDISQTGNIVTVVTNSPLDLNLQTGATVLIAGGTDLPAGYKGNATVTAINVPNAFFPPSFAFRYTAGTSGLAEVTESPTATASFPRSIDGHVDPRQIMDVGVMNGNLPAPLIAIDEDDEFFLTLTNVGMLRRPALFEQQPAAGGEHGRQSGGQRQLRLQRRRRLYLLRRRVPDPDARLRSELPLRRHDLQPRRLCRHEGQVFPAERPQLPGHGHPRAAAD